MLYLSLVIFLLCGYYLPWWALAAISTALGLLLPIKTWKVLLAGAIAWAALAYVYDGQSHGLITQRMSGLFAMPSSYLMFVLMAAIGALTAGLFFQAGASFRRRS